MLHSGTAVLKSIEFKDFRGIRTGALDGIAPLTILTGTNGSGKSSALDAMLLACGPQPGDAVGRIIRRHEAARAGSNWLTPAPVTPSTQHAAVAASFADDTRFVRFLKTLPPHELGKQSLGKHTTGPFSRVCCWQLSGYAAQPDPLGADSPLPSSEHIVSNTHLSAENTYSYESGPLQEMMPPVSFVRLIDPGRPKPLHASYSDAKRAGFGKDVEALLKEVGIDRLEILTEPDGQTPALYATIAGQPIPLALSGDGLNSLAHTAIELATVPQGLALLEEPDSFQHPSSLAQTARAIVAGVRRGLQVIVSTHSLELIDQLMLQNGRERADVVVQFTLQLSDGLLSSTRRTGPSMYAERWDSDKDLR